MISFKGANRDQMSFMPYDLNNWLPEDHLARFVVEIVDQMDLRDVYTLNPQVSYRMFSNYF